MQKKVTKLIFVLFIFAMQMPMWRMILYAFSDVGLNEFSGFSFKWFFILWEDENARSAFLNSFFFGIYVLNSVCF